MGRGRESTGKSGGGRGSGGIGEYRKMWSKRRDCWEEEVEVEARVEVRSKKGKNREKWRSKRECGDRRVEEIVK